MRSGTRRIWRARRVATRIQLKNSWLDYWRPLRNKHRETCCNCQMTTGQRLRERRPVVVSILRASATLNLTNWTKTREHYAGKLSHRSPRCHPCSGWRFLVHQMRLASLAIFDSSNSITAYNEHNIKLALFKHPGLSPHDVK